ncbi:MAG: NUDIX domain-containing protein [Actinomycetota bacterium]
MDDLIREAASLIAVREGAGGPEVLVLERSGASRFLPGYVVFPGGAADADDAELAARWFGTADETARACAVRELAEEAGLALTDAGLVCDGALDSVDAAPPALHQLGELARWIAPRSVPVRFDARFFVVAAGDGPDPTPDGTEAVAAWWASPRHLLREWEAGVRKLYWPTWFTMQALARAETVDELLALRIRTREPDDGELGRLPRSVFRQD